MAGTSEISIKTESPVEAWIGELKMHLSKLQDFKTFVHRTLDEMGVPKNPNPKRTTETGCRIGERLKWIAERLEIADDYERQQQ